MLVQITCMSDLLCLQSADQIRLPRATYREVSLELLLFFGKIHVSCFIYTSGREEGNICISAPATMLTLHMYPYSEYKKCSIQTYNNSFFHPEISKHFTHTQYCSCTYESICILCVYETPFFEKRFAISG